MKEPIRIVRNDSITEVEDADGRLYKLNVLERTEYLTSFLDIADTLKITQ